MKDYKIIKKIYKHSFCILLNIELICFINPDLLKKNENFLKSIFQNIRRN